MLEETGSLYLTLEEMSVFPDYMMQMVKIGEQTGNLDEVMTSLSVNYEREEQLMQDMKSAVTYPVIMLGMMLVILFVMLLVNSVKKQIKNIISRLILMKIWILLKK